MKKHFVSDKREYYRKEYLKSEHWAKLKARVLTPISQCAVCGRRMNLDVHHRHYRNLYDVTPRDLIVLCRKHHDLLHLQTGKLTGRIKENVLEHRLELMLAVAADLNKDPF